MSGVVATVDTEGSLVISTESGTVPILKAEIVTSAINHRANRAVEPPFTAVVAEGALAGQRGFSAHCDDDGDGLVDEDRLDGADNDGDGLVDEDFAAISDAMVVVHQGGRQGGGGASHLEYYHWAYPHLRSTVFLSATCNTGLSNRDTYRLVLGDHHWHEATLVSPRHNLAGRTEFSQVAGYIAQPARSDQAAGGHTCDSASGRWVGVVVLSALTGAAPALAGGVLAIPLDDGSLALAVCVADSWLQLNSMLNEAARVYAGALDRITGRRAPWIAPPLCALCRLAAAPEFSFRFTTAGELVLTAEITPDDGVAIDPDLFQIGGQALGAPREIQWLPRGAPVAETAWTCMSTALLDGPHDRLSNPYGQLPGLLSHQATGKLRFVFAPGRAVLASGPEQLQGHYLDGRPFDAKLRRGSDGSTAVVGATDSRQTFKTASRRISLSPKLLESFPNPFRDYIQLQFKVPATMGEAFVWSNEQEPPRDVSLAAAVPWRSGTPSVSVKIYSLNGQELVTLFAASRGPGQGAVQWDGTDSYGRRVAAGTYFCKLQMDEYSITRRLVYLR